MTVFAKFCRRFLCFLVANPNMGNTSPDNKTTKMPGCWVYR